MQSVLKEIFSPMFEAMLNGEMDNHGVSIKIEQVKMRLFLKSTRVCTFIS